MVDRRSVNWLTAWPTRLLPCCDWSSKSSHNPLLLQLKIDILICHLVHHIRWYLLLVTVSWRIFIYICCVCNAWFLGTYMGLFWVGMLTGLDFHGSRKNFPFPGKKIPERENFGKLRTIHRYKIPWQQLVRKSMDAAQRTLPDAGGRPLCGVISFTIAAGVC